MSAQCPECDAEVKVNPDVEKGEIISCAECGVDLEVVEPKPLQLRLAPKEEEDWGE